MSATGRSDVRHPDDFYATPAWCTESILDALNLPAGTIVLDPSAGAGAILDVCDGHGFYSWGLELDVGRYHMLSGRHNAFHGDALDDTPWTIQARDRMNPAGPRTAPFWCDHLDCIEHRELRAECMRNQTVVVMNPPFKLAMPFVQRACQEYSRVVALLRLNWLASIGRADWLREHTPAVYVLPRRPSFTGDGRADATDYAWMVWGFGPPTINILNVHTVKGSSK